MKINFSRKVVLLGVMLFLVQVLYAQTGTVPLSQLLYLPVDAESMARASTSLATMPLLSNIQNQPATLIWNINEAMQDRDPQQSFALANRQIGGQLLSSATYSRTELTTDGALWGFYANLRVLSSGSESYVFSQSRDYHGFVVEIGAAHPICNDKRWSTSLSVIVANGSIASNIQGGAGGASAALAYDGRDDHGTGLTAGLNVRNITTPFFYADKNGSQDKVLPVPADVGIGAAMNFLTRHRNRWLMTLEVHKTILVFSNNVSNTLLENHVEQYGHFDPAGSYTINIGWEYKKFTGHFLQNAIVFRLGSILDSNNQYYSGITAGGGVIVDHIQINVAYFAIPMVRNTPYGNNVSVGIAYAFKGISKK